MTIFNNKKSSISSMKHNIYNKLIKYYSNIAWNLEYRIYKQNERQSSFACPYKESKHIFFSHKISILVKTLESISIGTSIS